MKVQVIDNGTSYLSHLLSLLNNSEVDVLTYSNIPSNLPGYDLILLSGGHSVVICQENEQILEKELNLIRTSTIPIIGICYGCELIAYAYGSEISLGKKIKGIRNITKIGDDMIFNNINDIKVFENHEFSVKSLPESLVGLALSENGYEIFKHKTKLQFGFQFHPEMLTDRLTGDELFRNCIQAISHTKSKK